MVRHVCCLMAESGTYGASGVLWGYLGEIFSCGGSIGKVDGLCV